MSELPNVLRALASLTLAIFRPTSSDSQAKGLGRNQRSWDFLPVLRQDLAFGFRQLRKSPGYAAVSIGSLALGIGASVAVFSVVRAVLLDPYPYKDPDRMVHLIPRDRA